MFGIPDHFLGVDWAWNWFDFSIVAAAIYDGSLTFFAAVGDDQEREVIGGLTIIRLIRLVRITRLVRLIRLKIFHELSLMVNGVIGGLKTLFWAMVFLLGIVYSFGVLMRQLLDPASNQFDCQSTQVSSNNPNFAGPGMGSKDAMHAQGMTSTNCNRGSVEIDTYGDVMFSSVGRAMLTVFNCLTDSCSSPGGSPLMWHLWDAYGFWLVMCYVVMFIFVTFGIFNLILAIFVESTMAYAHESTQKRASKRHVKNQRHARKLQQLLIRICTTTDVSGKNAMWDSEFERLEGLRGHIHNYCSLFKGWIRPTEEEDDADVPASHLNLHVDKKSFEEALELKEVQNLLEDLEIEVACRDHLFEVLDADGNGFLAVSELAEGIMRLRGPADKGDAIATVLMLRSLQQSFRRFRESVLTNQQQMMDTLGLDTAMIARQRFSTFEHMFG